MPRLSIEDDAWPRIDLIANRLKWNKREVIGTLALLWRDTQRLENEFVTLEDIARITGIRSKSKLKTFVDCLVNDLKIFMSKVDSTSTQLQVNCNSTSTQLQVNCNSTSTQLQVNLYLVHGTRLHIDRLNDLRQRGKLGGRPANNKPIGFAKNNPIQYNAMQYNTDINPPIIDESSNPEKSEWEGRGKYSDLVSYAEQKLGVKATKPQIKKFTEEAAHWPRDEIKSNIDFIAEHPKASKETKSILRAFHKGEVSLAMSKWDKRLKIEIRRILSDGNKASEVIGILQNNNSNYDPQKLARYAEKIISEIKVETG